MERVIDPTLTALPRIIATEESTELMVEFERGDQRRKSGESGGEEILPLAADHEEVLFFEEPQPLSLADDDSICWPDLDDDEHLRLDLNARPFQLGVSGAGELGPSDSSESGLDLSDSSDSSINLDDEPSLEELHDSSDEFRLLLSDDPPSEEVIARPRGSFDRGETDPRIVEALGLHDESEGDLDQAIWPAASTEINASPPPSATDANHACDLTEPPPQPVDNRSVLEILGVTQESFDRWQSECRAEIDRIRRIGGFIVQRRFHERVETLVKVLDDIVRNCDQDPGDIREERGLPIILERMTLSLQDYLRLEPRALLHPPLRSRLVGVQQVFDKAVPQLEMLLAKMRGNDAADITLRAEVISKIFGQL